MTPSPEHPGAGATERMLVRVFAAAVLAGLFIVATHVTYHVEVFRGFVFMLLVGGLAVVGLIAPLLRGRALAVHRAAWLGAALVVWAAIAQWLASHAGYLGDYQVAKLIALGVFGVVIAARRDVLTPVYLTQCLAVCIVGLATLALIGYLAGWQVRGMHFTQPLAVTFTNQNLLGPVLVVSVVLLIGLSAVDAMPTRWRWFCWLAAAAGSVMIIGTRSRIALAVMLVAGVAMIFIAVRLQPKRSTPLAVAAAAAFVAVMLGGALLGTGGKVEQKVARMVTGQSASDDTRRFYYAVAFDHATDEAKAMLVGHGFSSFSRMLHRVDPRPYDYFNQRITTHFIHSEYIEWLHDTGIVGVALFIAMLGATAIVLARRARAASPRSSDRQLCITLLVALLAWVLIGAVTVGTRYAAAQALLIVLLGLAWQSPGTSPLRIRPRWPAAVFALPMLWAIHTGAAYFQSERYLVAAHDAVAVAQQQRDRARLERGLAAGETSLRWRSNNVFARYECLQAAVWLGDLDAATEHHAAITQLEPHFADSDPAYALLLVLNRRFDDALRVLEPYQRVAPNDYRNVISIPAYAVVAGDQQALGRSLLRLVADAVAHFSHNEAAAHRAELVELAGEPVLRIHVAGGATLTLTAAQAPGVILGRTPTDSYDAQLLIAAGVNRLLRENLGATQPLLPEKLGE